MLRDRGNDRNVNLGVSSIPERVESAAPGSNDAGTGGENEAQETKSEQATSRAPEEGLELPAGNSGSNILEERQQLQEAEDTCQTLALHLRRMSRGT